MKTENLILTSTIGMSKSDWLAFRWDGLGASEVPSVMGYGYKPAQVLFYEKIGYVKPNMKDSYPKFFGRHLESFVADQWESFKTDMYQMMDDYEQGIKHRRCKRINAYVQNKDFAWLFCSLDREINKTKVRDNGALEIKTMNSFVAQKWETGVPIDYFVQLITQMLICGYTWGELCIMTGSSGFDSYHVDFMPELAKDILKKTKLFWDNVLKARILLSKKIHAEMNNNRRLADDLFHQIMMLEPPADDSERFTEFLKEKYKNVVKGSSRIATADETETAEKLYHIAQQLKQITKEKDLLENTLKNSIGNIEEIIFKPNKGVLTWKHNGSTRRFSNKIKV